MLFVNGAAGAAVWDVGVETPRNLFPEKKIKLLYSNLRYGNNFN